MQLPAHNPSSSDASPLSSVRGAAASLTRTTLVVAAAAGTLVGMTAYETARTALAPSLSMWQSHGLTVVFSTLVATAVAAAVLRVQSRIHHNSIA